jgi:hypothetical protein
VVCFVYFFELLLREISKRIAMMLVGVVLCGELSFFAEREIPRIL